MQYRRDYNLVERLAIWAGFEMWAKRSWTRRFYSL